MGLASVGVCVACWGVMWIVLHCVEWVTKALELDLGILIYQGVHITYLKSELTTIV